jgi:hypothetical protein
MSNRIVHKNQENIQRKEILQQILEICYRYSIQPQRPSITGALDSLILGLWYSEHVAKDGRFIKKSFRDFEESILNL